MCCEFGNYIMQHVLHQGPKSERDLLLKTILKNFHLLSTDKCGSHVIEKALKEVSCDFA